MNIGINARHLIKDRLEGIGWYSFEILKRLIKLMPSHQFIFFYDRKTTFLISGENITILLYSTCKTSFLFKIWFNFLLPKAFKNTK